MPPRPARRPARRPADDLVERITTIVDTRIPPLEPRPTRPKPGQQGPAFAITGKELQALIRKALSVDGTRTVWTSAGSEVAVQLDSARVALADGMVIVGLTLSTDQTGPQELTTVFAVGTEQRPAGLVAVAEQRPRGHAELSAAFGSAVIATVWRALLQVVTMAAAAAGRDGRDDALLPAAIVATADGVQIVPFADPRLGDILQPGERP